MSITEKAKHILVELKGHAPFTLLGAGLGIIFMIIFRNVSSTSSGVMFSIFHPSHVVLSAMVTASMFRLHALKKGLILVLLVGYFGSIGIATLSDIVIPHVGAKLLKLDIISHAQMHHSEHSDVEESAKHSDNAYKDNEIHLGFIEDWYIVNPAALLGILIAYFLPRTKFPHMGHVLVSTWASSSYLLMNIESEITIAAAAGMFGILFIAIWVPCCISDIVFPLLFVKSDLELSQPCELHAAHSHPHVHTGVQQ